MILPAKQSSACQTKIKSTVSRTVPKGLARDVPGGVFANCGLASRKCATVSAGLRAFAFNPHPLQGAL